MKVKFQNDFRAITVANPRDFSLPLYFAYDYKEYLKFRDITSPWDSEDITRNPEIMRFECTGKITSNGKYEIRFVQMQGISSIYIGDYSFYKRDEPMTYVRQNSKLKETGDFITIPFEISNFEARTPLFIELEVNNKAEQQSSGTVFIKK